ncbi:MAG: MFS transporter, partial [Dysgonamonadaceae bacterium]|nr:MFS transporter [Dysgonamonadaceae bacterium]
MHPFYLAHLENRKFSCNFAQISQNMKEKLISRSYCYILSANFLLYFGFYLLMPVLPFYLTEVFSVAKTGIGLVLACYTIATLFVRPFSGFLLDTFARKPLYLVAYFIFTAIFAGYLVAGTLFLFTVLRILHGFSFGMVSVAGNTIVIDVTPSSRRGEALGYYGLANNIAMAVGPMTGLFMHDHSSFDVIFTCSLISCGVGFLMACSIRTPVKQQIKKAPLSLDRFILMKGLPVGAVLLLVSIPYGMTSTYIAMYGKSIGITGGIGLFFTLMAVGTAIARLFSGRQVDKGRITQAITGGLILVCCCFLVLSSCARLMEWNAPAGKWIFFGAALFMGIGFGSMFPAF